MTSAAKANRNAKIVDRLEAENERLRAALREILADLDDPDLIEISAATIARARQAVVNIQDAARDRYREEVAKINRATDREIDAAMNIHKRGE